MRFSQALQDDVHVVDQEDEHLLAAFRPPGEQGERLSRTRVVLNILQGLHLGIELRRALVIPPLLERVRQRIYAVHPEI